MKSKGFAQYLILVGLALLAGVIVVFALGVFGLMQTGIPGSTSEEFASGGLGGNIPDEYREIFVKAGDKWKVQPAFIAAMFLAGEHHAKTDTFNPATAWPNINGPWASSPMGASGPFQFMPATWSSNKQDGNGDGTMDIMNIWDASFGSAHLNAMNGAGGNTTDLDKLRDAASRYNSGRPWAEGQGFSETRPYVLRVIQAFQYFFQTDTTGQSLANFDKYKLLQTTATNIYQVRRAGCAVTSVSMAINYMLGNPLLLTPNMAWQLFTSREFMQWGSPQSRPSTISGKIVHVTLSARGVSPSIPKMKCYLNEGVPIVLGANKLANGGGKKFTSNTHWVLVIGISTDNKNFILADPMGINPTYPISSLTNPSATLGTHIYVSPSKRSLCQ